MSAPVRLSPGLGCHVHLFSLYFLFALLLVAFQLGRIANAIQFERECPEALDLVRP